MQSDVMFEIVQHQNIVYSNSPGGMYMFSKKTIYSLALLMTIVVTICRPGMGDHRLNPSVQTWEKSMAGSSGVVVYDKEGPRRNRDKDTIRLFNDDGSLWYEFSFYENSALFYLNRPNADFTPFGFDLDVFVLTLKCARSDADRYEVIVNEESGLRKFVRRDDPVLKFQRWEEHVVKWDMVDFNASTNPARSKPDTRADIIRVPTLPKDYVIMFHPDNINGDWLRIHWNLSESGTEYQNKDEFGWIRWRNKENGLIVMPLK